MHLELHTPPALVAVVDDGQTRQALLMASRGGRCYVQVSRGPGLNCLRWVTASAVTTAADVPATQEDPRPLARAWVRSRSGR